MKVTSKIIDNKNVDKSLDIKNSKKTNANKDIKDSKSATIKDNDSVKVSISDKAKEFKAIKELVSNTPDVDIAKIQRIKTALKDGKFDINYDKLAEKIVEHDIMYDLLN
jgi:flagellar biosynthesis anti-sigma factor FlgM